MNTTRNSISSQIRFAELRAAMASCEQTAGQTVLQHGEAVAASYEDLLSGRTDDW